MAGCRVFCLVPYSRSNYFLIGRLSSHGTRQSVARRSALQPSVPELKLLALGTNLLIPVRLTACLDVLGKGLLVRAMCRATDDHGCTMLDVRVLSRRDPQQCNRAISVVVFGYIANKVVLISWPVDGCNGVALRCPTCLPSCYGSCGSTSVLQAGKFSLAVTAWCG